ncbi:MAG: UvrD-helicase domain-containing protein [Candidatus Liptonbacteria bacterium]|nr:UvrD-helicase domain-containing protein [Candidatus Liptonbacteria bacterium]
MKFPDLNPQQKLAVQAPDKPLLIVAGAGTGKTRTLTSRLLYLIDSGIPAHHIIAITFTNKAAKEMADRVNQLIGELGNSGRNKLTSRPTNQLTNQLINRIGPFIGTFHSLGARILRSEARHLGRTPNFVIFDSGDSLQIIKKIAKSLGLETIRGSRDRGPAYFAGRISRIKNRVADTDELERSPKEEDKLSLKMFERYEEELLKQNAFDFDDLIGKVAEIFKKHPKVLEKYRKRFRYVLVDEYQDLNNCQYELVRLLAGDSARLSVVGDDQQCVIPDTKILTTKGVKRIKDLTLRDSVIGASGNGGVCAAKILKIKKMRYRGPLVKITVRNGATIALTPNHLLFAKLNLGGRAHVVYLMYRKDKGFRIGIAKEARKANGRNQAGLIVRSNQEKADKIWILKICQDRTEAEYYEYFYAFTYGIPTVVFDTGNRNMKMSQNQVNRLYQHIDTRSRALKLMEGELLYFGYPHWIPQGTVRHAARRLRARITLFDDKRKSVIHPWGMSRISLNTRDKLLKKTVEKLGFETRKGKLRDWRMEIARLQYKEIEKIASRLERINDGDFQIEFVKSACLTKKKRLFFQPASHARPGMLTASYGKGKIIEEIIKKVEVEDYWGFVYDLDVENIHNYIANNTVVHNSIYGFRGCDFRNFLNFENDWPDANVIFLEENYRSTSNIIRASSSLIRQNTRQKSKNLWTKNEDGAPVKIAEAEDEDVEAEWIAEQVQKLISLKVDKFGKNNLQTYALINLPTAAVLYRTNAQSRAIEQALIERSIPYRIFGGLRFYERKEIKDIVAALRLVQNPKDEVSRERLEKNLSKGRFMRFREFLKDAKKFSPQNLVRAFLETTGYAELIEKNFFNAEERMENIAELMTFASGFSELPPFLEQIALLQPADMPAATYNQKLITNNKNEQSKVTSHQSSVNLMTIHLAKGLEFDTVFVAGCAEGILPHNRSLGSEAEIEEERRLMYVAMTRAKKELHLSFYGIPSRFLGELPVELTEFESLNSAERRTLDIDSEERYITLD